MKKTGFIVLALVMLVSLFLTGCSAATTASCAYVVGDGSMGNDAKIHDIIYPGQTIPQNDGERVWFVPCNSRNFIVNDGTVIDTNGQRVGDRTTLITAYTSSGVQINIGVRALWTLNQSDDAMRDLYNVLHKYNAWSSQDQTGEVNNATPGWNDMLAENFGPALEAAAQKAAIQVDDTIWELHDPKQYEALGNAMAELFPGEIRANLGYSTDLFCGSGNSTWPDPEKPGEGEFYCSPVRIIVSDVRRGVVESDESTAGALSINEQRLENARALYGEDAGYWLAVQDTVEKCQKNGTLCIFNFGNGEPPLILDYSGGINAEGGVD